MYGSDAILEGNLFKFEKLSVKFAVQVSQKQLLQYTKTLT